MYTQMNSKVGFWQRQLGNKFLVFARALLFSNGRSLQTKNLCRFLAKTPTFEFICVYVNLRKTATAQKSSNLDPKASFAIPSLIDDTS
jgi:hypothetical protein